MITSNVKVARMTALKHALALEIKGLGRRGRSVYSIIKKEFNLRGNRRSVHTQFSELTEQAMAGQYIPPEPPVRGRSSAAGPR